MSTGMRRYAHEMAARLPAHLAAFGTRAITVRDGESFGFAEQVALPWMLHRTRPRLVHHLSLYAPLLPTVPAVVTVHDVIHLRFPEYFKARVQPYYRHIVRPLLARAVRVITDDERTVAELEAYLGVDPRKVRVIPLGVDGVFLAAEFDAPPAAPARERPYVVYAGNHCAHKNLATLAAAWAELAAAVPYDLVCTGEDDFPADWPRVRPNGARLICLGELDDRGLARVMYEAAALVYPSLCEGFGLPMLEALAVGTAVIASDEAVPGVLRPVCTIVPAEEPQAWTAALTALRKPAPEERVERRAYSRAFTWDRCAQATAGCYREILEEEQSQDH